MSGPSWLPSPTAPVDCVYMYKLGEELVKRPEPSIGNVPTKRLADIIQLGERNYDEQDKGLFVPFMEAPNGARTFIPADLDAAEEAPLRSLAEQCDDPIMRGRIYEVLLARFPSGRRDYQPAIVSARIASLALFDGWPDLLTNIVRATALALQAKNEQQLQAVLTGWDLVGATVLATEFWWAFAVVAVHFAKQIVGNKWAKARIGATRLQRWDVTVRWLAHRATAAPHFQRQMVLDDVGDWCGQVGDVSAKAAYQRDHVADIMSEAKEIGGLVATFHLSRAMKLAGDRGFKDLMTEAKRAFPIAATQAETEFKTYRAPMQVPQPIMDAITEILDRSPDVQTVLHALAAFPILMQLSMEHVRASAKKSMENTIAWRLMPSMGLRDRKIASISNTEHEKLREQVALVSGIHIAMNDVIVGNALRHIIDRLSPSDLYELVSRCPGLERARLPLLATASERFHARDWISSGVLVAVLYEAVVRDFVRWTGYPARGVTPDGLHADQTLGEMLSREEVIHVLGEEHVQMVRHVLLDPEHGMNLRNEVAHGTVRQEALSPGRVLLVWLFMIRLSFLRPIEDDADEVGEVSDDGATPVASDVDVGPGSSPST